MAKLEITGGRQLKGEITVSGNKNSTFGLVAASLLADSPTTLTNVPNIRDVEVTAQIIEDLGGKVSYGKDGTLSIDPRDLSSWKLNPELTGRIRGSVVLVAPILARFGKVEFTRPGGDSIGERLLDAHFSVLASFGAKLDGDSSGYKVSVAKLSPANIFLEKVSVTATEMALILAAAIPGKSIIENAAAEPHIVDLASMLTSMGAKISGASTNTIEIYGSKKLVGVEHRVRPDHIEVGTFAIAAAITGGDILIHDANKDDLKMILAYLGKMGVAHKFVDSDTLQIKPSKLVAKQKEFQTRPWPGFPTDLMSQFIVLATQTQGRVLCHDWMYETRMFFVDYLKGMGADIVIADPHRVFVSGPSSLHGEIIPSPDIRAGGALVLAALAASGTSVVEHAEVIERGYESFDKKLASLGADIKRVD